MKIVRTKNGEMIAGDYSVKDGKVTVKNPLFVVATAQGAMFVDILGMISSDNEVTFDEAEVFCILNPAPEVAERHNAQFSKIKTPDKKIILGV